MSALATISASATDNSVKQSATDIEVLFAGRNKHQWATRAYVEAKAQASNIDDPIRRVPTGSRTLAMPVERLVVLQDWEGVVEDVRETDFVARLIDKTAKAKFDSEAAEISKDEVGSDDLELLKPGAIFYLTVFRRVLPNGRQERATRLIFRRLPAWTPTMLKSVESRASTWKSFFSVGKSASSATR